MSTTRLPLEPHDAAQTLAASGIAPLKAKLPAEERTVPVAARAYPHPGLDGKIIVRIESEAVADGVDAEMAAFGFEAPKVSSALGLTRYRTLGFPAWGLVNVPKTAKVALGVMEDVRKAKRMVASKPGHAKEAFEKIAKTLQKASPMLLPSFWEEVGRTVADLASASMAAQCFERARQAERAFKLKVDPDDCDSVFVEFALLGALSAKSLSQYAKDLVKSEGGATAYKRFRAIAVKRALGGMPPWSGMGKDIRSLAKDAELDVDKEDESLVAELLEAPAIGKAPMEFWTTYNDAIIRLAKSNEAVRAKLRNLWPEPSGGRREDKGARREAWVQMLDEVGALSNLPDRDLGTWVSRLIAYAGATPRVIELLKELAPRLSTQPIAVITPRGRWGSGVNLDLAETALGLGIALVDPDQDIFAESMTCDPVLVAAHPTYGKKLVEIVAEIIGDAEHEHRMRGKKGFDAARRAWVEERLKTLAEHSLACTVDNLDTIESKTTAETFLAFPELWQQLKTTDLSAPLATLLRGGLADEFGWQAYEDAFAKLGGEIHLDGSFPNLVLWNASKAIALGPSGVVAEHDLVYKAKEFEVERVSYLDGQFLVTLEPKKGWQRVSYWSGEPKATFEDRGVSSFDIVTTLADGSITLSGDKTFRAGDKETGGTNHLFVEGTRVWKRDYRAPKGLAYEMDPAKGSKIGNSLPAFLSEGAPEKKKPDEEWTLDLYHSRLYQAPNELAGTSPLGIKNGQAGLRIWYSYGDDGREYVCTRIDGVTRECANQPEALVMFPGDPVPKRATADDSVSSSRFAGGSGPGIELYGDDEHEVKINEHDWCARGWGAVHVPPLLFWHYLTPRDEAGSKVLRAITTEQARQLLATARAELTGDTSGRTLANTEAKIRALGITNDKLVRGVAGIVELAAEQAQRLETIAAERSKENADAGGPQLTGDGQKVRKLLMALHAGRVGKFADFDIDISDWLQNGRKHALDSTLPFAEADDRRKARDMLAAIAATPFGDDTSQLRIMSISEPDDWSDPEDWNTVVISKDEGSIFAVSGTSNWALELSTDGKQRTPKPWNVEESNKLEPLGSAWCAAFAALPDTPVAWDPQFAVKLGELAGLTVPEATLLYCGIPHGWRKDFLGKQKRDLVGLKMSEADAARTTFQELDNDAKTALFVKAVPDDASLLATPLAPDGYVERLGKAWKAKFGKRAKIPQDLIAAAKKELSLGNDLAKYLPAFAGAIDDAKFLKPDLRPFNELGGWGSDNGLTWHTAQELATLIAWLFVARPVGCPIRAGIPAVVKALVKCVEDPKVFWKLDDYYVSDDDKGKKLRDQLFDLVGGKSVDMPKSGDTECKQARDDGAILIANWGESIDSGFRPAKLGGAVTKKVETLALALWDKDNGGEPEDQLQQIRVAELLRSDGFAAFAERVADTEVEDGKFEADPRQSAPKLVAKVAKATDLSNDGATLYLQILAMAEPTERNVQTWNGWTAKQYKAVAAELVKKKLVIEGKRERAGRGIFLKGGYGKGNKQDLPMEDWKLPFYSKVLDRHVPHEPVHLLFARAWKRIEDGDKPA